MKIMFVIPRMNSGGAERVVANLACSFSKEHKVLVCSLVSKESFYDLKKKNIFFNSAGFSINRKNKFTVFYSYSKFFFKSLKFIKKNINDFKPDCIISFLIETDILTYLATRKNKDIVKIFSERNDPTRRKTLIKKVLKKIYKSSDLFVCQSKKVYEYYDYISSNKKVIISNPIDYTLLPRNIYEEKNHNIVSVGRLNNQKNFELLINSYIISKDELPDDCKLIIYGEGKLRENLEKLIKMKGMEKDIFLPGSQKNVMDLINGSALFVLTSNYEGFPNALLEAMAIGLPVISTNFYTGIAKELIKNENGIIVPVNDEQKLAKAIVRIMNDKQLRKIMKKNNVKLCKKFDVNNIASIWIDYIKKAVDMK